MPRKNGPQLLSCGYKYCFACREPKPVSEFHRNRSKSDGRASQCKACSKMTTSAVGERRVLLNAAFARFKELESDGLRMIDLIGLDAALMELAA